VALSDAELAGIATAGADVRAVFDAPSTTTVERKQLIRAVIAEIVLTLDTHARVAALRIIWQGGAATELTKPMTKRGGHTRTTDEDTLALIRRLAADYDDRSIAAILAKQGWRTASGLSCQSQRAVDRHQVVAALTARWAWRRAECDAGPAARGRFHSRGCGVRRCRGRCW
jgi:hypothetical protein